MGMGWCSQQSTTAVEEHICFACFDTGVAPQNCNVAVSGAKEIQTLTPRTRKDVV